MALHAWDQAFAVIGSQHDGGAVVDPRLLQRSDHATELAIDEVRRVHVAVAQQPRLLLRLDRDR
jgi:hypothetical protein